MITINDKIKYDKNFKRIRTSYGDHQNIDNFIEFLNEVKKDFPNGCFLKITSDYDDPYIEIFEKNDIIKDMRLEKENYEIKLKENKDNLKNKSEEWLNEIPRYGSAYHSTNKSQILERIIPQCEFWIKYYEEKLNLYENK